MALCLLIGEQVLSLMSKGMARSPTKWAPAPCLMNSAQALLMSDFHTGQHLMKEEPVPFLTNSESVPCLLNLVQVLLMYDFHMALHLTTKTLVLSLTSLEAQYLLVSRSALCLLVSKSVLCLMGSGPELFLV